MIANKSGGREKQKIINGNYQQNLAIIIMK